jgi:hypothetical protein
MTDHEQIEAILKRERDGYLYDLGTALWLLRISLRAGLKYSLPLHAAVNEVAEIVMRLLEEKTPPQIEELLAGRYAHEDAMRWIAEALGMGTPVAVEAVLGRIAELRAGSGAE